METTTRPVNISHNNQKITLEDNWLGVDSADSVETENSFNPPAYCGGITTLLHRTGRLVLESGDLSLTLAKDNQVVFNVSSNDLIKIKFTSKLAQFFTIYGFTIYTSTGKYKIHLGTVKANVMSDLSKGRGWEVGGISKLYYQVRQILSNVFPGGVV